MRPRRTTPTPRRRARAALPAVLAAALLLASAARADISVRATVNSPQAHVGDVVILNIEASGAQNVPAPAVSLQDFDVRYSGPSTQVSIVNGAVSASIQHRYVLVPRKQGKFSLGPFTVEFEGRRYDTPPVPLEVSAASAPPRPPADDGTQAAPGTGRGRALFATLTTARNEVYLHESIPLEINLYVGPVRAGDLQYPNLPAEGLSVTKFPDPTQQQQVIDGQTYQVVRFRTTAIPMRAGTLTVGPASLRLNVYENSRRGGRADPFFDSFFQQAKATDVRSEPLVLTVLPLPDEGKPASFSGAVGAFDLQVHAAPTEVAVGDPITLRMSLVGDGNLGDAGPPALADGKGFRLYDPQVAQTADPGANKTFEQVLIPTEATVTSVPPVRFAFFDPRRRRYEALESQPIPIAVRPPQAAPKTDIVAAAPGPSTPERVEEKLGRDIVYIKDDPGRLGPRDAPWYQSSLLLLWLPLPPLLFFGGSWYDRRRRLLTGDERYARFTRAGKRARAGLAAAAQALATSDRPAFYDAVSRTLQDYLAAKLDLPRGAIDADAVAARGVAADCVAELRKLFDTCESIRFAPTGGDGDMRGTLTMAENLLKRLEREVRTAPQGRTATAEAEGRS